MNLAILLNNLSSSFMVASLAQALFMRAPVFGKCFEGKVNWLNETTANNNKTQSKDNMWFLKYIVAIKGPFY